ncbi:hypothetical protein HS088_TW20G00380 [Tripterygium wilfordii]|uniref:Hydroxyproline-rich glycoprotein family protein n=1 Tax=Tripterygium wilfordii TaxID=458696 RepID=A0A7J7C7C6_TRIWF|nr:uncharacterized protein LOC119987468 [Tripterygium wilfordii]KAF5730010.1 hypothetical protein HS088_TW20G00380 [Tripterygium wilfordii]
MRGVTGDSRAVDNTFETINAAASAIASAENRVPQATVQKRRWGSCWSIYWCFGFHKHRQRIGHAVLVPESTAPRNDAPPSENPTQTTVVILPFVAPPSSPASFLQSEPPSATQSPAGMVSFNSISANMYSPGGPSSIFAIGPYAHETQLVSPPVFSTFTTEPSTAPFTPPPESVHLTTPSSPEVPFAQLLDPSLRNLEAWQRFPFSQYEFQSYHLYPGSPIGQLISPSSGISSGTSSPFPDGEFASGGLQFLEFKRGDPPKLLNLDKPSARDWRSYRGSGGMTPDAVRPVSRHGFLLDRQLSDLALHLHSDNGSRSVHTVAGHRVSFELTAENVVKCVEMRPAMFVKALSEAPGNQNPLLDEENSGQLVNSYEFRVGETSNETPEKAPEDGLKAQHQKHRSITLGSVKEFNFDNTDGGDFPKTSIGSDWWANEKVVGKEDGTKDWSFFPTIQPGVS